MSVDAKAFVFVLHLKANIIITTDYKNFLYFELDQISCQGINAGKAYFIHIGTVGSVWQRMQTQAYQVISTNLTL